MAQLIETHAPTVGKKLQQSRLAQQVQSRQKMQASRVEQLKKRNNNSRVINSKEGARSREMLQMVRHNSSSSIKASRRQN